VKVESSFFKIKQIDFEKMIYNNCLAGIKKTTATLLSCIINRFIIRKKFPLSGISLLYFATALLLSLKYANTIY
jgi:hypothetical protein